MSADGVLLELTRLFPAPRARVFEFFTGAALLAQWWDPRGLAFAFEWEPADPDDEETLAQLAFEVTDDLTRIQLRQGPFKTEARRALHRDGWTDSLDKLAELVTQQRYRGRYPRIRLSLLALSENATARRARGQG